jgi:hypothetical protein
MAQENSPDRAAEVAEVEEREAQATLGNDLKALDALWSESLIVSSSANLVLTKSQASTLFRAGRIRLKTFERRISKLAVIGDVALATGTKVSPSRTTPRARNRLRRTSSSATT